MLRVRLAYWMTKATEKHSEYVMIIALPRKYFYTNAPHCNLTSIVYIPCLV